MGGTWVAEVKPLVRRARRRLAASEAPASEAPTLTLTGNRERRFFWGGSCHANLGRSRGGRVAGQCLVGYRNGDTVVGVGIEDEAVVLEVDVVRLPVVLEHLGVVGLG